jgi:hypothetical protein
MLTYDVAAERLTGSVGNRAFSIYAVSGGGRGSTVKPEGEETLRSWNFEQKEKSGARGGPIPPGWYICKYLVAHPTFHRSAFLQPTITALLNPSSDNGGLLVDRDFDFFIHQRAPKGSD